MIVSSSGPGLQRPVRETARNQRPVVLLHGTLVEKEGIEAFRDHALETGHPVDHRTYPSIKDGHPIQESAELVSRNINNARLEIARDHLDQLVGADRAKLEAHFQLQDNLYGAADPSAEVVLDHLPQVIGRIQALTQKPQEELETGFSGQLEVVERDLARELAAETGRSTEESAKMAAEVVDSIAPKAVLVGHSAGGFVAYTMAVNPEITPDDDPFTYDGANGIGEVLVLSSPIAEGMNAPAPPGIADMPFYMADRMVLRPLEAHPMTQLARLNPFFDAAYVSSKALAKTSYHLATQISVAATAPLTYMIRPGYEQVMEGAEFLETYVKDKPIPEDLTVIAVTSPLDMMSLENRSQVDGSQRNGHNFSVDLEVSQEDLERERPTWTHVRMTEMPEAFQEQFADKLLEDPGETAKLLDPCNDDGVRHQTLVMLGDQLAQRPGWEQDPALKPLLTAMQEVAAERQPFKDSPSYLAYQLLKPN